MPVEQSVFGADPFEPVRHSDVRDLITEQADLPVSVYAPLQECDPLPEADGVLLFDAETLEDLKKTGQRLLRGEKLHIMAGCAGFASILPQLLSLGTAAKKTTKAGVPAIPPTAGNLRQLESHYTCPIEAC